MIDLFNLLSTGPLVMVGLTQTSFSTEEGEEVTVCTQMKEGSADISQPLVVTIQTGHTDLLVGSEWL